MLLSKDVSVEIECKYLHFFDIDNPETSTLLGRDLQTSRGNALMVVHGFNMLEEQRVKDMGDHHDKNRFEAYQQKLGSLISLCNQRNIPVIAVIEADPFYGGNTIEKTTDVVDASVDHFIRSYNSYVTQRGAVYFIVTLSDSPTPLTDNPDLNPLLRDEIDVDDIDYEKIYRDIRRSFAEKLQQAGLKHALLTGTYLGGHSLAHEPQGYLPRKPEEQRTGIFGQFEHPGCIEDMYAMLDQSGIKTEVSRVTYPQQFSAALT